MAVISTLLGGVCGFLTFVTSLIFFDVSLPTAFGLYVLSGLCVTLGSITLVLAMRSLPALLHTHKDMRGAAAMSPAASAHRR
ncbi:hypothetical protein [Roseobacter ponti]|uniref:Uncharacterized protein n=1 Tax=Roseobacter ponti TaxID=1891787 RepID=A0A858ST85_9RHOB|nr:hypothetical protein [Roseobacter ponti]QJF50086.1 hypothetical protein G3256_02335 [Roseobacter ponti]